MVPTSIDSTDGVLNLGVALGFLSSRVDNGVYISMGGLVAPYYDILKDRESGTFNIHK
jgi:L-asparaginase